MADFEIFIKIVLYLLLALAFFSNYFVSENNLKASIILVFFFGISAIIFLTIFRIKKENILWAYLSITPFILMILHTLTRMFYQANFNKGMGGGLKFIIGCGEIIFNLCTRATISVILLIIIILLFLIKNMEKNKK